MASQPRRESGSPRRRIGRCAFISQDRPGRPAKKRAEDPEDPPPVDPILCESVTAATRPFAGIAKAEAQTSAERVIRALAPFTEVDPFLQGFTSLVSPGDGTDLLKSVLGSHLPLAKGAE